MAENIEEENKGSAIGNWFRSILRGKEGDPENPQYDRRLFDGRIEKYLDQNMDTYIDEYGILTGLDLESYENRYEKLTSRISVIRDFMIDSDAIVTAMENDIKVLKKESKKKK